MGNEFRRIADEDGDTYITVEPAADGDIIRMYNQDALTFEMSADGERIMPTQPAFSAYPSAAQENIAKDENVTVAFGSERFDQNNDFAGNAFTAPVTGRYHFDVSVYLEALQGDANYYAVYLVTSNKTYLIGVFQMNAARAWHVIAGSVLADMDADDTAYVIVYQSGGTTGATDIGANSFFSGALIC